ncbi:response regulator [Vitiosangium sp. GDMCC 1.1324]|uniref:response regulator n=1 Tax=Vitiosangium sp. (strain GDMCC 1.1324) TaxID=2138576 RepID=UPI000D3CCB4D|nr:response regulator [Vitiosangium sp. GDMCC 1.1324]PTL77081.1 two-component system response regulator [Vitiosangium sp. GDMCC 1.1324]
MSKILLVDDEPELLELYTDVLEIMGCEVTYAHDGLEALELAHRQRPDLIVTDWMMPRMDGVELCWHVVHDAQLQGIPIILHSTRRAPRVPGVLATLSKVCPLEEFEDAVAQALEGIAESAPHPRQAAAHA